MLRAREILGDEGEPRFVGRTVERVAVSSSDAPKRRLRTTTDQGTDVAVDLERGAYLRHGAVLADDGERIIVVERQEEEAVIVTFPSGLAREELLTAAVRLGHAYGNQHVPLEVVGREIRAPVTTSRELAADTVQALGIAGVNVSFGYVRLGCQRPLGAATGHGHV
jgi:urease accessory protein